MRLGKISDDVFFLNAKGKGDEPTTALGQPAVGPKAAPKLLHACVGGGVLRPCGLGREALLIKAAERVEGPAMPRALRRDGVEES